MKSHGITFAKLRELLLDLGFTESITSTRKAFVYGTTGTYILFRPYDPKDYVSDRDILVVRRQLVDNGLIEPTALERFLEKSSA